MIFWISSKAAYFKLRLPPAKPLVASNPPMSAPRLINLYDLTREQLRLQLVRW
jgi:hypothetical protein